MGDVPPDVFHSMGIIVAKVEVTYNPKIKMDITHINKVLGMFHFIQCMLITKIDTEKAKSVSYVLSLHGCFWWKLVNEIQEI